MAKATAETINVDEAAKRLGISRASAYKAVRAGELPSIRIGNRFLVLRVPFERLLQRVPATAGNGGMT